MVLPGDEVSVKLSHIGMKDSNVVVKVEPTNQRGDKIIQGATEVAQPPTVYVFTGQGSQEPGMGMDLCGSSPAVRAVWDGANEHLLAIYGLSIIELVKQNPKEKTMRAPGFELQFILNTSLGLRDFR
jgi:fatty acid synthase subunit alpha, fungi type/fatty acid synthase subunit beta, fungi type